MSTNPEQPHCDKCEQLLDEIVPATWALTHRPCGHVKHYCDRHHAAALHAFEDVQYIVCGEHTPWQDCTSIHWAKL